MAHQSFSGVLKQEPLTEHDTGYVAGVDIGGTNLRVALSDSSGAIIARQFASTAGIRDPQLVVDKIHVCIDELLHEKGLSRRSLLAVAAGAPRDYRRKRRSRYCYLLSNGLARHSLAGDA